MDAEQSKQALEYLDPDRAVKLTQDLVRIPSPSFEEVPLAEFIAAYLDDLGIEVRLEDVVDPFGSGRTTKQPIGIIRGDGSGQSLMFNGHMDHNPVAGTPDRWERDPYSGDADDTYVYGRGSIDEKGGIVGFLMAAEAIKKWGIPLKGDLILCPVMGHKLGAVGTLHNLRKGLTADLCINTETTDLGIITAGVGVVRVRTTFKGRPVHFASPDEKKATAAFAIPQMARFIDRLGPVVQPIPEGDWLTFTSEPDLPGYPQYSIGDIASQGIPENFCKLTFQIRLVPGQTAETVRADLERLVDELGQDVPNIDASFEIPPYGDWDWPPYKIEKTHQLPSVLARWHEFVSGKPADVGCGPRLGAVGDANYLANAGITSVQYGPGGIGEYDEWPAINERLRIDDLLIGARTMTLAAVEICGA